MIPSHVTTQPRWEGIMRPVWTIRRTAVPRSDGHRRWDQSYQRLLQWAPTSTNDCQQEVCDACCPLRAGFDYPPSPSPNDRPAAESAPDLRGGPRVDPPGPPDLPR